MSDSESMSSDDSDNEFFTNDFIENIPEDSDSSDSEDDDTDCSTSSLKLEVGLTFPTWKVAFKNVKQWAHQQGFNVRKGRSENVDSKRKKQTIVCHCEGVYNNKSKNKSKPSKSHRTNYKWHVNLSRPIRDNSDNKIFITTLFNEHFRHDLNISVCHFEASKSFTKPMLNDIEWMYVHGYLKPLAIKCMLN